MKRIKMWVYNLWVEFLNLIFRENEGGFVNSDDYWKSLEQKILVRKKNEWIYFLWKYAQVRDLMWRIKFLGDKKRAKILGQVVAEFWIRSFKIRRNLVLVQVPAHPKRVRERGFNQTEVICDEIYRLIKNKIQVEYWPKNFRRIHYDQKQSWKKRGERFNNLGKVYAVKNPTLFKNKVLIIFDDVVTTGATMEKTKNELAKCQPKKIIGLALGG